MRNPSPTFLQSPTQSLSFDEAWRTAVHINEQLPHLGIKEQHDLALVPEVSLPSICVLLACLMRGNRLFICSGREPLAKTQKWLSRFACHHILAEKIPPFLSSKNVININTFDFTPSTSGAKKKLRTDTVFCTSGSTAAPKAVQHSLGAHFASAHAVNSHLKAHRKKWLLALPLFHVGGFAIVIRALASGSSICLHDPNFSLIDSLKFYRPDFVSLVPTQCAQILQTARGIAALQGCTVILGGAPAPTELLKKAHECQIKIIQSYGCTESASLVVARANNVSKVLSQASIKIGLQGTILLKSASLCKGYLDAQGLQKVVNAENFYDTGDIGFVDESGLQIKGRKDNMMISGGENIHPEEIESALQSCPGISQAVVAAKNDAKYGQRPIAFIQRKAGCSDEFIRRYLQSKLASYKIPDSFLPWPEDAVSVNGKISRTFLKEGRFILRSESTCEAP